MQVILQHDVPHLGDVGEVVNVKAGYARNYLIPRGFAIEANERRINQMHHEMRLIEQRVAKQRMDAQAIAKKLEKVVLRVNKAAGENDKLFGSVTVMEIEALLREKGFNLDRRKILLDEHIKTLGHYEVGIKLHRDVVAYIRIDVLPKED
ncbi:50S ribosomal protein L9 [Myxococcota bacterium]|nr:50S ribosomal protein L9 [Myxococcota bacterium]MBU1431383.1 50S ribosomal protein L9 [Myxococcota bacterium]MBU1896969.1 50S ribosomal protein L9 [Myxococcota bacterium]